MPWTVTAPPDVTYIELCVSGDITRADLSSAIGATVAEAMSARRALVLADCSQFRGGLNLIDTYMVANARSKKSERLFRKQAIVLPTPPKAAQMAEFWRTFSVRDGFNVKSFKDRKGAIEWLLKAARSPETKKP